MKRLSIFLVMLWFCNPEAKSQFLVPGLLDLGFRDVKGANSNVRDIVVQPNNLLLIGGNFTSYNGEIANRIARIDTFGNRDLTFLTGTGFNATILKLALQSDGKILACGNFSMYNGVSRLSFARLNPNGSLDTGFSLPNNLIVGNILTTAIQTDGRIIVGGNFTSIGGQLINRIARLLPNGDLDTTVNIGLGANNSIVDLAIQTDGKIVIAGFFTEVNGISRNRIARLNTDLSLDTTFNPGLGANQSVNSISIQPDGKIIAGGSFNDFNTINTLLIRLNSNGSVDPSFGLISGSSNININKIMLMPDGRLIVVGFFSSLNNQPFNSNRVARILPNGTIDTTFYTLPGEGIFDLRTVARIPSGTLAIGGFIDDIIGIPLKNIALSTPDGGIIVSFNQDLGISGRVSAIAMQPDSMILIGGNFSQVKGRFSPMLARLFPNGSIDTTFNTPLGSIINFGNNPYITSIALQPDGKILIGGLFFPSAGNTGRVGIMRLMPNGTLDASFAPSGANNVVNGIAVQSTGSIVVVGQFTQFNGIGRNRITLLTSSGATANFANNGTLANGTINTLKLQSQNIIIGGAFTNYQAGIRQRVGRVLGSGPARGGGDGTFNSLNGANNTVRAIAFQPASSNIFIAGEFTTYAGTSRSKIALLSFNGVLNTTFVPPAIQGNISSIAVQDDQKVIIAGDFTTVGGQVRNGLARLNANGSLDTTFITSGGFFQSSSTFVDALLIQNQEKLLVGGQFFTYSGFPVSSLIRVNLGSGIVSSVADDLIPSKTENIIRYYPNPSTGLVTINTQAQPADVRLFSLQGVYLPVKITRHEEGLLLDLSEFNQGLYLLQVGEAAPVKLVKE